MTAEDFGRLLAELRVVRTDHQFVEAKTAGDALPETTHESLSALSNAGGGTFILGLDEASGAFNVTGVANAAQMLQSFQSLCGDMEPPLRPIINVIAYEGKNVIVAEVPPVAPHLRPCHRQSLGEYRGSFIRVGDADQAWTSNEVDEARTNRAAHSDFSARPAPPEATLDEVAFEAFAGRARHVPRNEEIDDNALKRRYGVVTDEGHLTIAAALALGDSPERLLAPARVAYRVVGAAGALPDARFQGEHVEGTVGELLDQLMERFARDLKTFQISRNGRVWDELEVPRDALREIVSNALMHRSLTPVQETRPITIEITPDAVVVMSPGSLFTGADLARLGLDGVGGTRNPCLVRICDFVRTPSGDRIVENHASGIPTADQACREAGAMPPLFIDRPAMFHAVLMRQAPDLEAATGHLAARDVQPSDDFIRIVAVTAKLEEARQMTVGVPLASIVMDARFGARTLGRTDEADAAHYLRQLEEARVLQRRVARHTPFWAIHQGLDTAPAIEGQPTLELGETDQPKKKQKKGRKDDRLFLLLEAVDAAGVEGLTSGEIGDAIGVGHATRGTWIEKAMENGWIEVGSDNVFDRTRRFTITAKGLHALRAMREKKAEA